MAGFSELIKSFDKTRDYMRGTISAEKAAAPMTTKHAVSKAGLETISALTVHSVDRPSPFPLTAAVSARILFIRRSAQKASPTTT